MAWASAVSTVPAARAQEAGAARSPAPLGGLGGFNPLAPAAPVATPAPQAPASNEYEGLPDTHGVDLVYGLCGACHSVRLVTQQKVTPERWDYLLDWMVAEQNMPELPPEDRQLVFDYLVRHYSSVR